TLVQGSLNTAQTYAVQVPGQVVIDLVGDRVEDVQLQRGTAQLWFQAGDTHPVQVRWFPGSQEACDSFTLTVGGGTEDENRHAALEGAAGSVYLTLTAGTGDQLVLRRPNTGSSPSGQAPLV